MNSFDFCAMMIYVYEFVNRITLTLQERMTLYEKIWTGYVFLFMIIITESEWTIVKELNYKSYNTDRNGSFLSQSDYGKSKARRKVF